MSTAALLEVDFLLNYLPIDCLSPWLRQVVCQQMHVPSIHIISTLSTQLCKMLHCTLLIMHIIMEEGVH